MEKAEFAVASLFSEEEMGPRVPTPQEIKQEEKRKKEEERKKQAEETRKKWEELEKKRAEEEEKKNTPPADMERIVCYARERRVFPAGASLDEIRKELSEEFWELTGENVKMEWEVVEMDEPEGKTERLIVRPLIAYAKKGMRP